MDKIITYNNFINENKNVDYSYYMNQINNNDNWKSITNILYNMIEEEGWVDELLSYNNSNNDNLKNKFTFKKLELSEKDINGLINMEEDTLEYFNDLDIKLKNSQKYPFHTLDFIDYDKGIVYIIKYNE